MPHGLWIASSPSSSQSFFTEASVKTCIGRTDFPFDGLPIQYTLTFLWTLREAFSHLMSLSLMFQTKANQKKMAEIDLFTFPPLDTEHTARWAEVSNPHPGQRNATAPGASTRLTEMVTSLQDLPSNNSSKGHPCHPFNACRCPKNDTQVVCKNAVILGFGWTSFILLKCWGFMNHMNRVPQSWRPSCNFCKPKGDKGAFQERHANSTWRPGGQEGGLLYADKRNLVSFVDRFETNVCPYELYAVFL